MIELDVECYYWHKDGMRKGESNGTRYVEVHEVERLLEEAHRRGFREGEYNITSQLDHD